MFNKAVQDDSGREAFCNLILSYSNESAVITAYQAAAKALQAKNGWNPLARLSQLKQADALFESAIDREPSNIELRFLRLSVQYYTPRWLGLSDNLEEDKKVIISNIHHYKNLNINDGVIDWIQDFMITSGFCDEREIATIKAAKAD
ncbi:MAG: hypothetical protein AAGI07_01795 [Bacteroidota bacterium]